MRRLGLLLLLLSAVATAQTPAPATVFSSDRRFAVFGPDVAGNQNLLRWMETHARLLEQFIKTPLPIPPNEPLLIRVSPATTNAPPGVTASQRMNGARFIQELNITDPDRADPEDMLEAFTVLLLYRGVHNLRSTLPPASIRGPADIPAWFSTGCAQNLHRASRTRNRVVTLRLFDRGEDRSAMDLLALHTLPQGRWSVKAECGMLVAWLASRPDFHALSASLLREAAAGTRTDADWVIAQLGDTAHPLDLNKHWDLWRMHSHQVRAEDTGLLDDPPGRLAAFFPISREHLFQTGVAFPRDLPAAELHEHRGEKWFAPLIGSLRADAMTLSSGQPPEFRAILEQWDDWFRALLELPVPSRTATGWSPVSPARKRKLDALREAAVQSLDQYTAKIRALERFVDLYEEAQADTAGARPDDAPGPRSAHQSYVDQFDKPRDNPGGK